MDNATFHKGKRLQELLQKAGHYLVWLPKYSPDLNPIEKMWAQVKSVRKSLGLKILISYFKITAVIYLEFSYTYQLLLTS